MEYLQYYSLDLLLLLFFQNVLNLVISGIPSILDSSIIVYTSKKRVLNLVISGIPSIHNKDFWRNLYDAVLNLVISGIPSIPL